MKTSAKAMAPCLRCFAAFTGIGWQPYRSGDPRLDKRYKIEIIVKGPDGKIIPIIGRAPR